MSLSKLLLVLVVVAVVQCEYRLSSLFFLFQINVIALYNLIYSYLEVKLILISLSLVVFVDIPKDSNP